MTRDSAAPLIQRFLLNTKASTGEEANVVLSYEASKLHMSDKFYMDFHLHKVVTHGLQRILPSSEYSPSSPLGQRLRTSPGTTWRAPRKHKTHDVHHLPFGHSEDPPNTTNTLPHGKHQRAMDVVSLRQVLKVLEEPKEVHCQ